MRVFLSWSGDPSRQLAETLREWIPNVIQAAQPYYSPGDIAQGARWSSELAEILADTQMGILCLTADNITSPWITFEAGALSKGLSVSRAVPLLFGFEATELTGPLVQFQAARFGEHDIRQVLDLINSQLGHERLSPIVLERGFEKWWPDLETRVQTIMESSPSTLKPRPQRDILEEILLVTRDHLRRAEHDSLNPRTIPELVEAYTCLVNLAMIHDVVPYFRAPLQRAFFPIRHLIVRLSDSVPNRYLYKIDEVISELDQAVRELNAYKNEEDEELSEEDDPS